MDEKEKKLRDNSQRLKELKITKAGMNEPYIFVSYKSDDWREALEDVTFNLQKRFGLRVYYDREFETNNDSWIESMNNNMENKNCLAVLAFYSERYVNSYATLLEILTSQKEKIKKVKEIIPVFLDDAPDLEAYAERAEDKFGTESTNIKKIEWDHLIDCINNFSLKTNNTTPKEVKISCERIKNIKEREVLNTNEVRECFIAMQEAITKNQNKKMSEESFYNNLYQTILSVNNKVIKDKKKNNIDFGLVFDEGLIKESDLLIPMTPKDDGSNQNNADKTIINGQNTSYSVKEESCNEDARMDYEDNPEDVDFDTLTLEEKKQNINECVGTSQKNLRFLGAHAIELEDGIIVLKGSIIKRNTSNSCPAKAKRLREEAIRKGELVSKGFDYQLVVDKAFRSLSGAAQFVGGYSISGNVAWEKENDDFEQDFYDEDWSKNAEYIEDFNESIDTEAQKDDTDWINDVTPHKTREKKENLVEMVQKGMISAGAKVYVKEKRTEIGIVTEEGTIQYKGKELSISQYVLLVLGPGSRNAYQYVVDIDTEKTLAELRESFKKKERGNEKSVSNTQKSQIFTYSVEKSADDSLTIGHIRKQMEDNMTAFDFREIRENMPRGGKGAMDYAMAAILGGCNAVKADSPSYQINYYTYAIADLNNKKENGGLGATWTWSSNCRKVLRINGAGQIPKEIDQYFKELPESTTLKEIEEAFVENSQNPYQTGKNDIVIEAIHRIYDFFRNK